MHRRSVKWLEEAEEVGAIWEGRTHWNRCLLKQWQAAGQAGAEVEVVLGCTKWVLVCSCRSVAPWGEVEAWADQDSRFSSSPQDPNKDGVVVISQESQRVTKPSTSKLRSARTKMNSQTCFSGASSKVLLMVELQNETWSGSLRNYASNAAVVALSCFSWLPT